MAAAWEVQRGGQWVDVCKPVTNVNPWRHCRLNMADHVFAVFRGCYFQLHQLWVLLQSHRRRTSHSLTLSSAATLTRYCRLSASVTPVSAERPCESNRCLAEKEEYMPSSLCNGYRFGNGRHTSWRLGCTVELMAMLRSTWQSPVIQVSISIQEWGQQSVGSSTYCEHRLH